MHTRTTRPSVWLPIIGIIGNESRNGNDKVHTFRFKMDTQTDSFRPIRPRFKITVTLPLQTCRSVEHVTTEQRAASVLTRTARTSPNRLGFMRDTVQPQHNAPPERRTSRRGSRYVVGWEPHQSPYGLRVVGGRDLHALRRTYRTARPHTLRCRKVAAAGSSVTSPGVHGGNGDRKVW